MDFKNFSSGQDLYNYVQAGNNLYSKSLDCYVFEYNDAGALALFNLCDLTPEELVKVVVQARENKVYWEELLICSGVVLDDRRYDNHRYSEDWEKKKMYLRPSLEFCNEFYSTADWLNTNDVTTEYILEKEEPEEEKA